MVCVCVCVWMRLCGQHSHTLLCFQSREIHRERERERERERGWIVEPVHTNVRGLWASLINHSAIYRPGVQRCYLSQSVSQSVSRRLCSGHLHSVEYIVDSHWPGCLRWLSINPERSLETTCIAHPVQPLYLTPLEAM